MSKQDVVDYVMDTPHNPNKAVLRTLLDGVENNSDSSDNAELFTFLISYADENDSGNNYTCNKTFDEITEAWLNKKILLGAFWDAGSFYSFTNINATEEYIICWCGLNFEYLDVFDQQWHNQYGFFYIHSDNTITIEPYSLKIQGDAVFANEG